MTGLLQVEQRPQRIAVRLGIPSCFPRMTAAANDIGASILISANALRNHGKFRLLKPGAFAVADVALDSAGFVAMMRYQGFPWTVAEYVEFAGSYPWTWWAAMDLCCEPQIANDNIEVLRRVEGTVELLWACRRAAAERGISMPMPVVQGWAPDHYQRCVELMGELPPLVGVGSVCRRHILGPAGLVAVIERLDRVLPKGVCIHLFGAKGTALAVLAGHPRIASVDSMAWDFAARRDKSAPYSVDHRIRHMCRWYREQTGLLVSSAPLLVAA